MADYCYWNNENRLQKGEQGKFYNSFYIAPFEQWLQLYSSYRTSEQSHLWIRAQSDAFKI